MEVFRLIGVGVITAITALIVKQIKPEVSIIITIAGGILMILMLVESLTGIFNVFNSLIEKTGLSNGLFSIILKIIGVGYIAEFSANLCYDAGANSIADKILFGGKIIILALAVPIVSNIINILAELVPWEKNGI